MTKDHIIQEIIRTAKENGNNVLGRQRFENETGIKLSDWLGKYWAKWSDAVKEAGYEPNSYNQAYDVEYLLCKLIELIKEIKKFPTAPELRLKENSDNSFPSHNTFERIGNKQERARRIVEYCEKIGGFEEVINICLPIVDQNKENNVLEDESISNVSDGFVYLIKSGKNYKIGRSNSANRREYELKIQLPEKADLVHKIKTDDPVGIEAYWHNRFKDKRKNGEWFELSSSDVKIFRRRKFM